MRHTPQPVDQVALVAAEDLTCELLGAREAATKAVPLPGYVRQLRKDIRRQHAKPCVMTLAIQRADLRAGVPLPRLESYWHRGLAIVRAWGAPDPAPASSWDALTETETRLQVEIDLLQYRVGRADSDIALRKLLALLPQYRAQLDALERYASARLYRPAA